jgi:hypothetical protein
MIMIACCGGFISARLFTTSWAKYLWDTALFLDSSWGLTTMEHQDRNGALVVPILCWRCRYWTILLCSGGCSAPSQDDTRHIHHCMLMDSGFMLSAAVRLRRYWGWRNHLSGSCHSGCL